MNKTELIQIRVSKAKKEKLKEIAKRKNLNMTMILCNYIDEIILKDGNINFNNIEGNDVIKNLIDENLILSEEIEKAKQRARRGGRKRIIEDEEIIKKIQKSKKSYLKLSKEYGISVGTIQAIKKRKGGYNEKPKRKGQ